MFLDRILAVLVLVGAWLFPARGWAQACCAGASAVTPGRLELHEAALAGVQLRAAGVFGHYTAQGRYVPSPSVDPEDDFEQDLFGAVRVLRRGQIALLVPFVETMRATPQDGSHIGGGVGDVNLSARYDFVRAGEARFVPGIALLAGVTFPTGAPVESVPTSPLAVDATGVGAFQGNVALALERAFGPWLVNATTIVAARTPRFGQTLGTQVTVLAATAYTFGNDAALALSASYAFEGDAVATDGMDVPFSSKRVAIVTVSALWPVGDAWRLIGGAFLAPPVDALGSNQPVTGGLTITLIRSWS
ncbi:MAG TPA: hypothetical protein VN894_03100 [Polyangiaceae bacterium]|nr:hypothetical protein [Polyangiaceae bacterium]